MTGETRTLFLDMNGIALRASHWRTGAGARPAYPRLADVAAPTLVAWGDLDFPHVQERSRHAARTIPGAEAREFVGAGHLPSLEDPAGFAALLDDFILRRAAVG